MLKLVTYGADGASTELPAPTVSFDELAAASERVRDLLGRAGDDAELTWEVDDDVVRLHLVVPTRRFLMPAVAGSLGLDEVDRTISVRREELQP